MEGSVWSARGLESREVSTSISVSSEILAGTLASSWLAALGDDEEGGDAGRDEEVDVDVAVVFIATL